MLNYNGEAGDSHCHGDDSSEDPTPRKRTRRAIVLSDNDEEKGGVPNVKSEDFTGDPSALSLGVLTIDVASSQAVAQAPTTRSEVAAPLKAETKGRPKAGDYDTATRSILQTAIEIYCAILLNDNLFPSGLKELEWAQGVWTLACSHHAVQVEHDASLLKLVSALYCSSCRVSALSQIKARSTHLRGQFKAKARPIVATTFALETSADKNTQEKNRALVSELKQDSSFIFRVSRHPDFIVRKLTHCLPRLAALLLTTIQVFIPTQPSNNLSTKSYSRTKATMASAG